MKTKWAVPLSELTKGQELHLVELCDEIRREDGYSPAWEGGGCIGIWSLAVPNYYSLQGMKEIVTYKKAVKRLNKLLERKQCKN